MKNKSRRAFLQQSAIAGLGTVLSSSFAPSLFARTSNINSAPAILGGAAKFDIPKWVKWPIWLPEQDEKRLLEVMRSGVWSRASVVTEFEKEWANRHESMQSRL